MTDEQPDLVEEMRNAAMEAARTAAGAVIGAQIASAYPDLPRLIWGADDGWDDAVNYHDTRHLTWRAMACVDTHDDTETRAIVTAYADALGGSDPREVDMGKSGSHLVTVGTFNGIRATVYGVLKNPAEAERP